jgi:hypothetical protein
VTSDFGFDDLGDADKVKFSEAEVAATLANLDEAIGANVCAAHRD